MVHLERPGLILQQYCQNKIDPIANDIPDRGKAFEKTQRTMRFFDLEGARFSVIKTRGIEDRYIRFKGLGQMIGRTELGAIGVQPHETYPDLVVAYPRHETALPIVPNEARHHVRRLRTVETPAMSSKLRPPLHGQPEPWVKVQIGTYSDHKIWGVDRLSGRHVDMTEYLPQTVEACMSVAQLMVADEATLARLLQEG